MIHSTSTTITPMTIQVVAVEDMGGSSEGLCRRMYGLAGAGGSGPRNAKSGKSFSWRVFRKGVASMALADALPDRAAARARAVVVETDVPARLDRLAWGRFHTLVVVALGVTWILD